MASVLKRDLKNPGNLTVADYVNFDDFEGFSLASTRPLGPELPTPVIRLLKSSPPVDFFQVGSMTIVSAKLKREFDSVDADFEYFDVELIMKNGSTYMEQTYYFAHLLKEIDCFDYELSEYTLWKGKEVKSVKKLVIHEELIDDEPLFRMKNAFLGIWLASESFVHRIKQTDIRGMVFMSFHEVML